MGSRSHAHERTSKSVSVIYYSGESQPFRCSDALYSVSLVARPGVVGEATDFVHSRWELYFVSS